MKAHEIMKTDVIKVKEEASIQVVIEIFLDYGISGLPVVNDRNEIVAYISDGDIMRFIGKSKDIFIDTFFYTNLIKADENEFEHRVKRVISLNVMEVAKKTVHKVQWNESIDNIAALLGNKHIKKLPVERNGVLVGIISRGDVIRHTFKSLL
ncbi:CBS domain-containing protein [Bacillus sp. Marseille-P3661]|uniref:CBS domain-containing protein n=1 Tax=Bacillus sp. Marseille-P3661 TaxID=1936234 RepID=UPI000C8429CB|nr:CBS domain-containing protein [Bacillus sp. Marseille-P3661]